ncbi:GntR family transcriptional regulator [Clostridium aestuarii]|uniref:GntR family transcriptional regulator n=1 Tax=Clostridium aestuarii TaxID=338193 RepID=A0ABT4D1Z2_9CLOT|nr:GntR family transcriptional regulator [Clostridium aestuarii]MCY6484180.1 GntR family transcriptional regulator [Clostridium aestuarii]
MKKVCKTNPLPLYYQIKEILQEMIENRELKSGELIPPEREICEIQDVSRMTVNKAVMALVNEGYLYREQGKGTFVAEIKGKQQLQLKGFTEQMIEKGLRADTKILSFKIKLATKYDREVLNIDNEDKPNVIEINRLRIINGEPFAIETVWLPQKLCSNITREMLEGRSLYEILEEEYRYVFEKAKQTIEPIMLNEYEAKLLEQDMNSLALMFRRVTYLENGVPIEHTKEIYRSDKYKYEVILT